MVGFRDGGRPPVVQARILGLHLVYTMHEGVHLMALVTTLFPTDLKALRLPQGFFSHNKYLFAW